MALFHGVVPRLLIGRRVSSSCFVCFLNFSQSVHLSLLSVSAVSFLIVLTRFELYWPTTWRQFLFLRAGPPSGRSQLDNHAWNLYITDRLIRFGYPVDPPIFCGLAPECPSFFFFFCPLVLSGLS